MWLIFNLKDEGENYAKADFCSNVMPLLESYLEKCWKVYINTPQRIGRTLSIMYNVEIQEYRARQDM